MSNLAGCIVRFDHLPFSRYLGTFQPYPNPLLVIYLAVPVVILIVGLIGFAHGGNIETTTSSSKPAKGSKSGGPTQYNSLAKGGRRSAPAVREKGDVSSDDDGDDDNESSEESEFSEKEEMEELGMTRHGNEPLEETSSDEESGEELEERLYDPVGPRSRAQ